MFVTLAYIACIVSRIVYMLNGDELYMLKSNKAMLCYEILHSLPNDPIYFKTASPVHVISFVKRSLLESSSGHLEQQCFETFYFANLDTYSNRRRTEFHLLQQYKYYITCLPIFGLNIYPINFENM